MSATGPAAARGAPADVIVVGAGVIGIACANYLADAGLRVTVVDQGAVAAGCSHANCGYVCPSHILPLTEPGAITTALRSLFNPRAPFRVKLRLSPGLWNWMWQFARRCTHRQMVAAGHHLKALLDASMVEYRRLIPGESLACEWKEAGLLYVFRTPGGMRAFAETDRLLAEEFGVAARRIEGDALPALDPAFRPGLAGAFHYPGDASVRPDLLNVAWARRLGARGVRFVEQCRVSGVEKAGGRVTGLVTTAGVMSAEQYVFATGAWSPRLGGALGYRIPIEQGKGYSVTTTRPDPCPRFPMLFPEHRVGVSPFAAGYRLGSMMEFAGFDTTIPPHRIQQLRDAAKPYLAGQPPDGPAEAWYGWRPMTWDSLPIIGRVPGLQNAMLATGHNMLGLSLAPGTGRLVAEIVTGRTPHVDPAPYSPARF